MKHVVLIILCLFISYPLIAQEKAKQKEVGIVFGSLNNFGFSFKTGTNKSLWRFGTTFINGTSGENISQNQTSKYNSQGVGVNVGKEFRKNIASKLDLRYGADVYFSYHNTKSDYFDSLNSWTNKNKSSINDYRLRFIFGFNYNVNENILFGIEMLPYFEYSISSQETTTNSESSSVRKNKRKDFNYGLNSSSVLLSLMYKF